MKLQLWTTTADGFADELLGEIDIDDESWYNAQSCAGDAYELISDLANEIGDDE